MTITIWFGWGFILLFIISHFWKRYQSVSQISLDILFSTLVSIWSLHYYWLCHHRWRHVSPNHYQLSTLYLHCIYPHTLHSALRCGWHRTQQQSVLSRAVVLWCCAARQPLPRLPGLGYAGLDTCPHHLTTGNLRLNYKGLCMWWCPDTWWQRLSM